MNPTPGWFSSPVPEPVEGPGGADEVNTPVEGSRSHARPAVIAHQRTSLRHRRGNSQTRGSAATASFDLRLNGAHRATRGEGRLSRATECRA
ncbi:hypothetical protein MICRO8M_50101 [Microbacterium sp. 8M]|nr:hypothetical protein MICRO8M_50101 [Microbacterium sp. 8M]